MRGHCGQSLLRWATPREGPATVLIRTGRSYRQARRPAKFAAVRFIFVASDNLQLPRERERRIK